MCLKDGVFTFSDHRATEWIESGGALNVNTGQQRRSQLCGASWEFEWTLIVTVYQHVRVTEKLLMCYISIQALLILHNNVEQNQLLRLPKSETRC